MLKIVKWLAILLVFFIALVIVVGFMLPKTFHVDRSIVIHAEKAAIHALVSDLRQWQRWTPWLEADPTIVTTFGPTSSGIGAHQSWTGESGGGQLTIIASSVETGIVYDMTFEKEMYPSVGQVRYETVDGGTQVSWIMDGESPGNPLGRYFGLMIDTMVGPMFEQGLEKLRVETEGAKQDGTVQEDAA
jgi:hypothetical protein